MLPNKTNLFPNEISGVYIRLSPPEKYNTGKFLGYQKEWQKRYHGEVTKVETLNYRTYKPEMDGLFCEKIFGPIKDWECNCGKYKGIKYGGNVCDKCGVLVTEKRVRQERMGYINLIIPIVHTWYFRAMSNKIGVLLGLNTNNLEKIIYYERYIVINQGIADGVSKLDLLTDDEYHDIIESLPDDNSLLADDDPNKFVALMGGEAIEFLLKEVNLDNLFFDLKSKLNVEKSHIKKLELSKRIGVVSSFRESNTSEKENKPEWMIMRILPVLPADLRPLVQLSGGKFATADINDLYRRVIIRKNRLARLLEVKAPDIILRNEKRMLQEAVDSVIEKPQSDERDNKVELKKSLSDALKGKSGLFRQNLLGKRVDYSARSVIVVGPYLKLYECGLPKTMALELYKPFVIRRLLERRIVETVKVAKNLIAKCDPVVWPILESVIKGHPVLLNRAPTLHRLSIQAFQPILIEGKAIQLHPLLCTAFNADFDGDQMAVHVPLSIEAIVEASLLLLSSQNIFNPANGKAITLPSKDIVLGCYYITKIRNSLNNGRTIKNFCSFDDVVFALDLEKIKLHELIRVRMLNSLNGKMEFIETSAGRIQFNLCLPKEMGFINEIITGKRLQRLVSEVQRKTNTVSTVEFLDKVKIFGFEAAYKGGISISLKDIVIPKMKQVLIDTAQSEVDEAYIHYINGLITDNERYNKTIDIWTGTSAQITHFLMKELENDDEGFNPIYMMVESGARGSREQIRQLGGIKGLMAKPNKNSVSSSHSIIEHPILSNFKDGLNSIEYSISAHGSRKGLADSALKTADAGYLTRKVVEVCQDVVILEYDCGAVIGVVEGNLEQNDEIVETLAERVLGRIPIKDVYNPANKTLLIKAGEMIDENCAEIIANSSIKNIEVRSVFKCRTARGVCVKCYGINFCSGKLSQIGDAVGVIAAQSIGEPGTQLTLKTFHVGGTALKVVSDSKLDAKFDGIITFKDLSSAAIIDPDHGATDVVLSRTCEMSIVHEKTKEVLTSKHIAYGSYLKRKHGDQIKKGDEICFWDPYNGVMLADCDGIIEYNSVEIGTTCIREFDEQTGKKELIVIESKNKDKYAKLLLKIAEGKNDITYNLPVKAHINVENEQKIKAGHVLYKLPRALAKSRDITGGLPRVTELLEVRNVSNAAILSEIDGIVSYGNTKSNVLEVFVESKSGVKKKYTLSLSKRILVQPNDFIKAGDRLSEGTIASLDLLNVKGLSYTYKYLVNELQEVYRLQGVKINDKHIEVVINQMMKKVEIINSGDTTLVQAQIVDKINFIEKNSKIINKKIITNSGDSEKYALDQIISIRDLEYENKILTQEGKNVMLVRDTECATAKTKLQGITRTSLGSDSFLSAASFQEVTKVLSDSALRGDVDHLKGLKENVIVGKLIPAGSGLRNLKGYVVKSKNDVLATQNNV